MIYLINPVPHINVKIGFINSAFVHVYVHEHAHAHEDGDRDYEMARLTASDPA